MSQPSAQTFTVTINATPETIWPYVGDLNRHGDWSPKPFAIEWASGEPNVVGSSFRSTGALPQDKHHAMEGSVTQSDAPKRFAVKSHDKDGEFVNSFDLSAEGGQTKVTRTVEFPQMKGAFVVLFPVLLPILIKPAIQKGMNLLKTKVEASA
jgi:uncharacterized protein YndB with AHSA1/START domain